MDSKYLAVIFPGIGYHKDKPLLYYASKLLLQKGYDLMYVDYPEMPKNIKGDAAKMQEAAELAYAKAEEMLSWIDFSKYQKKVFVGKSIGTVVMSKYIQEHHLSPKQIWYTPVEATFSFPSEKVIAFLGDADPWSDVELLKRKAEELHIPLYSYPNCNHSLETDDVDKNLEILRDVMQKTAEFVK